MFYAEMTTEHYTFRAVAAYRDEAVKAVRRGWKAHVEQVLRITGHQVGIHPREIEGHYGINVYEMDLNECMRDDFLIAPK